MHREFLEEVTRQTWSVFLRVPLTPIQAPDHPVECAALISIEGAWSGTLMVSCSRRLAVHAAATLYSLPDQAIDDRHWQDTLNEVANIIGGNLKALLPAPSRLGLPAAVAGGTPDAACTVAYRSDYGELYVTLVDTGQVARAATLAPSPCADL